MVCAVVVFQPHFSTLAFRSEPSFVLASIQKRRPKSSFADRQTSRVFRQISSSPRFRSISSR